MADEKQLFQAILDNPEDDTPRLVYADWLEENDKTERAEFIRVQCELAKIPGDHPGRMRLTMREDELLAECGEGWLASFPEWARSHLRFNRGFVGSIRCVPENWDDVVALTNQAPLRSITLKGICMGNISQLLNRPELSKCTSLHVDSQDQAGWELLNSEHLTNLKALRLHYSAEAPPGKLFALLSTPKFSHLTGIFFGAHVKFLNWLDTPAMARLTSLGCNSYGTATALDRLGRSRVGLRLRELTLWIPPSPLLLSLTRQPSRFLLRACPNMKNLRSLRIVVSEGKDHICHTIAKSENLSQLTDLELAFPGVTDEGIQALIESPHLPKLTRILNRDGHGWTPTWTPTKEITSIVWVPQLRGMTQ